MSSPSSTPPLRRWRARRLLVAAGMVTVGASVVVAPAPVSARHAAAAAVVATPKPSKKPKPLKAAITDDQGDAPSASVDIIGATASYTKTGDMRFTVTMAGPLDFTVANEITVLFTAAGCGRNLFGAGVDLTDPTAPWAYRFAKNARSVDGRGKAKGATYSARFTAKELAHQRPFGFQLAIYPPGSGPDALDETDCAALG